MLALETEKKELESQLIKEQRKKIKVSSICKGACYQQQDTQHLQAVMLLSLKFNPSEVMRIMNLCTFTGGSKGAG